MKIKKVTNNGRKKSFEIITAKGSIDYPYSRLRLKPNANDPLKEIFVDRDLGCEAFTYRLKSGREGTIHIDEVMEYTKDTEYLREMLLYKLTIKAQKIIARRQLSKREVIRRMGTSPTQFYRLMDQTYYNKTIDQMVKLLAALDCPVDLVFPKAA